MIDEAFLHRCRTDFLTFVQAMFAVNGKSFIVSHHHVLMANELEKVLLGETKRLIISVAPRYSKTEMCIMFTAWSLGLFPDSEYISTSYSKRLSSSNNQKVKAIVEHPLYQKIFPDVELMDDSRAKDDWRTVAGGIVFATSVEGTVTGFGAGKVREGFGGAIIIDDPIKATDASSEVMLENVRDWFTGTMMSRLNAPQTPIIIIMQRLHENDLTGFLIKGGNGEKWKHVVIPTLDEKRGVALWEWKHTVEDLERIKRTDPYNFASQYQQTPAPMGGGIFKTEFWRWFDMPPVCEYRIITADTASKTDEHNDYSVFQCWGLKDGNAFLLDQLRGKWESPQLRQMFVAFWKKHYISDSTVNHLRCAFVEDASSGTSLIQEIRQTFKIPIIPIVRQKDKVTRAYDTVPFIASGYVYLPRNAVWLADFISECERFTPLMTHAHDDQIDAAMDGIDRLLAPHANASGSLW